jgi:rubredoxin
MSEYWAYCRPCQRSFYVAPATSAEAPSNVACPVCLTPPAEVSVVAAS